MFSLSVSLSLSLSSLLSIVKNGEISTLSFAKIYRSEIFIFFSSTRSISNMASTPKAGIVDKLSKFDLIDRIKSFFGKWPSNTVTNTVDKVVATAGKIIESGGDIITAPAAWLKSMQRNWLIYLVLIAIIMVCAVFLYCSICYYVNRHANSSFNNNLIELANVISNKNDGTQNTQKQSFPLLNLPQLEYRK